jgi:FtsP/CotA-like multicopper oxidase with cupredoxin domain
MRFTHNSFLSGSLLQGAVLAVGSLLALSSGAAVPGISGKPGNVTFHLSAGATRITQPNGQSVYAFGYGCTDTSANTFVPAGIPGSCSVPQLPGPTLVVRENDVVTVVLANTLPGAAGNTSILFPGFQVTTQGGRTGLLTQEAPNAATCPGAPTPCNTVTYTFTAKSPGTHSYYSGTQSDFQIEMGLFGAVIVLPATPASCPQTNVAAELYNGEKDFRLSTAAYDNNAYTCYDREYLFQFSEMDQHIHVQAEAQVNADLANVGGGTQCAAPNGCLNIVTEPYIPNYFMINGRSMPDDMDTNYAPQYPNQPYNGNPHMHPGELTLLRIIGQGRFQHPFHEHANHVRILARDANLLVSSTGAPAGPLLFTTTTTPGMTLDGIFQFTGKGLNWDIYGHDTTGAASVYNLKPSDPRYNSYNGKTVQCIPDANGYYTSDPRAPNYYEWCGDHNKALEKHPFGQVAAGGPITLPDANILTNGAWYSGSPYFGPDAAARSVGTSPLPPFGTVANSPSTEAGYAYMWHSHNEREITTDNIFPGGMMMMMLVDPRAFVINEAN